jgi:hypothetical protein
MAAQLELDLRPNRPPGRGPLASAGGLARTFFVWTPVWVPLVFLGQVLFLGLAPARAEARRLDAAEREVRARVQALEEERDELGAQGRMLTDGIYRERVRRSLVDPSRPPLTLESARAERP